MGGRTHGHIPFTPHAKQALELSLRHAQRFGHGHIARPYLLLALMDVRDAVGAQTLLALGADLEVLAGRADALASEPAAHNRPE